MTRAENREQYKLGHITFETCDSQRHGVTFRLIAGEAVHVDKPKSLFTGFVEKGMATQLRRLAHHFDELEGKLK